jgi:hypothetical protein
LIGLFIHPIFSWLGPVFDGVADLLGSLPNAVPQVLFAAIVVGLAATWIHRFISSRRSALGHLSISDDDWFRIAFTAVASLAVVALIARWTGFSAWTLNSGQDLFGVMADKFDVDGAVRRHAPRHHPEGQVPELRHQRSEHVARLRVGFLRRRVLHVRLHR